MLLPLFVGSGISLVFAVLLAWYFSRPIQSIRHAFESIAGGRLDTRIGSEMGSRHDELSDLGRGFDDMADRLQGLVEGQQRLLHDVSHELRSPLARLQAVADLIQQQPQRAQEFITRIERESVRMDKLVGELLTLARLDAGIAGSQVELVDLNEMIATIAEDADFEMQSKGGNVEVEIPEELVVRGHADLLHRALENVARNAVKHSPDGGRVSILVRHEPGQGRISIDIMDRGSGIQESELKYVFDPFIRGSAGAQVGGYGLGLAITQRIVNAHKGRVSARNREGGGLVVSIELPCDKG
jgi:signal transduction histidine kinase